MGGDPFRTYDNLGAHPPCYRKLFSLANPSQSNRPSRGRYPPAGEGWLGRKNPSVGDAWEEKKTAPENFHEVILVEKNDAVPYNGLLSSAY